MRFRGIALLMHHRANENNINKNVKQSIAAPVINELDIFEACNVMDDIRSDRIVTVGDESDNLVDSEGIVYPAGARAGVEWTYLT